MGHSLPWELVGIDPEPQGGRGTTGLSLLMRLGWGAGRPPQRGIFGSVSLLCLGLLFWKTRMQKHSQWAPGEFRASGMVVVFASREAP